MQQSILAKDKVVVLQLQLAAAPSKWLTQESLVELIHPGLTLQAAS